MFTLVLSRRLFLAFRPVILCAFFLLTAEQAPLARTLLERNQLCEAQAQVFHFFLMNSDVIAHAWNHPLSVLFQVLYFDNNEKDMVKMEIDTVGHELASQLSIPPTCVQLCASRLATTGRNVDATYDLSTLEGNFGGHGELSRVQLLKLAGSTVHKRLQLRWLLNFGW